MKQRGSLFLILPLCFTAIYVNFIVDQDSPPGKM